jgi:hypothetical protein
VFKLAVVLDEREREEGVEPIKSCEKCSHLPVCSVYRAIAPLINSFEVRKPFEAKELAKICKEFTLNILTPKELNNARKLKRP